MPTYTFRCPHCEETLDTVMSIGDYSRNPPQFVHCGHPMDRFFPPTHRSNAIDNALAGDRHYDGMQTQDGVDISTRDKHRAYMKERGLTTMDDYKESWAKAEAQRTLYRQGKAGGAVTSDDIARAIAPYLTR